MGGRAVSMLIRQLLSLALVGGLILFVAAVALIGSPSIALAEDPSPPAVGMTILEDDLSGPTLIQPFACRTGRGGMDYVGEGLRLKLTGVCNEGDIFAAFGPTISGLTMVDGEARVDVKAVSGIEHARFQINARSQPSTPGALRSAATVPLSYVVGVEPGLGWALIGKTPGNYPALERTDLTGVLSTDDWNTVSIRLQGPNVWLMLNDQPVLFFSDDSVDRGGVVLPIVRTKDGPERTRNDPNDTSEVAVVLRNLRVSTLADADPARMPTYQRP
jgi:hypothetical protein